MGDNPIGMLGKAADGAAKTIAAGAGLIAKNAGERIGRITSETPSNSNEEIDPEDFFQNVLVAALGVPGVKINREEYLRSALQNYCEDALIDAAVEQSNACFSRDGNSGRNCNGGNHTCGCRAKYRAYAENNPETCISLRMA